MGAWIETFKGQVERHSQKSHPTWVRGLKHNALTEKLRQMSSHPTWVRGLKHNIYDVGEDGNRVAPYVGAWIETRLGRCPPVMYSVAPYVGAWIETQRISQKATISQVAPYVGAWIETTDDNATANNSIVAPYVGAWIETAPNYVAQYVAGSHPTWVRGLKLRIRRIKTRSSPSHPTWVRGLKLKIRLLALIRSTVAPYVGAWIET